MSSNLESDKEHNLNYEKNKITRKTFDESNDKDKENKYCLLQTSPFAVKIKMFNIVMLKMSCSKTDQALRRESSFAFSWGFGTAPTT